jgi:hypothetical protein
MMARRQVRRPPTSCEHAIGRTCGDELSQQEGEGITETDGPVAVSCLYSVMSRLSAVELPDARLAIVGSEERGK